MHFDPNTLILNIQTPFSMAWIPIEYYNNLEQAKNDLKTDIWAYATTLWEIFSHGFNIHIPNPVQFFANGARLMPPKECEKCRDIYDIMREGWDEDPDNRFSSRFVISRLEMASKYLPFSTKVNG